MPASNRTMMMPSPNLVMYSNLMVAGMLGKVPMPSIVEQVVIFYDNNWAIEQAKESRSHHRSKHNLRRYHLLREMVSRGDVRMDRVKSAENIVDPLTKLVSQNALTKHLGKMGLRSMGD
ncbi:hypothetical protein Sango_2719700 [Sesamum angolense]|uniref:Uncharacterized protein n=1 Tax=Sesamum angolense TaxID=2727404 RepID=A0AAE1W3C2_9LAMI|nr:hypothetical protein Sango_2719700 [Sesamum angolense]